MIKNKLKTGDIVEILYPSEIAETLDSNGTLDNLPFMAEMIQYCGKKFKVSYRIEKTCVECIIADDTIADVMREFPTDDVVALENLRCSGSSHDGCQTGCLIFWKEAWLRKIDDEGFKDLYINEKDEEKLSNKLKAKDNNDKYFCQATQLASSTKYISRKDRFAKLFQETLAGNIKIKLALKSAIYPKIRSFNPATFIKGQLKKTPTETLHLQSGELVEVKSYDEILKTLDEQGQNRGLKFYYGMKNHCGKKLKVRNRLDRMINEATGEMMETKNTVILEGVVCDYEYRLYGCPRLRFQIWREIWLKRVEYT
jgi:hypothetical protein